MRIEVQTLSHEPTCVKHIRRINGFLQIPVHVFVHITQATGFHVGRVTLAPTHRHHIATATHSLVIVAILAPPPFAVAYNFAEGHSPTALDSR